MRGGNDKKEKQKTPGGPVDQSVRSLPRGAGAPFHSKKEKKKKKKKKKTKKKTKKNKKGTQGGFVPLTRCHQGGTRSLMTAKKATLLEKRMGRKKKNCKAYLRDKLKTRGPYSRRPVRKLSAEKGRGGGETAGQAKQKGNEKEAPHQSTPGAPPHRKQNVLGFRLLQGKRNSLTNVHQTIRDGQPSSERATVTKKKKESTTGDRRKSPFSEEVPLGKEKKTRTPNAASSTNKKTKKSGGRPPTLRRKKGRWHPPTKSSLIKKKRQF